jgi:hypothetical protein
VCQSVKGFGLKQENNVYISDEWARCEISSVSSGDREVQLTSLRKKINKHFNSKAHSIATEIKYVQKKNAITDSCKQLIKQNKKKTESVFRTAYYLTKSNRPFTDYPNLIELQELNGVDCGKILHSRYNATEIVNCIADEMKSILLKEIISNESKIAVVIDESTTLCRKSCLVVYLKASVSSFEHEPELIFLDLIELPSQKSETITTVLLQTLHACGLSEDFLQRHLIAFVSDGAIV